MERYGVGEAEEEMGQIMKVLVCHIVFSFDLLSGD